MGHRDQQHALRPQDTMALAQRAAHAPGGHLVKDHGGQDKIECFIFKWIRRAHVKGQVLGIGDEEGFFGKGQQPGRHLGDDNALRNLPGKMVKRQAQNNTQ